MRFFCFIFPGMGPHVNVQKSQGWTHLIQLYTLTCAVFPFYLPWHGSSYEHSDIPGLSTPFHILCIWTLLSRGHGSFGAPVIIDMTILMTLLMQCQIQTRSGLLTGQIPPAGTIFRDIKNSIVTLTFDLLTSKSIGHILASWGVYMWSFMMIGVKGKQLCAGNHFQ